MTLFWYIFSRFMATFARTFLVAIAIFFVIGLVDELGQLGEGQGIAQAAYLSAIGQAEGIYTVLPLVVMIAAITMFLGMSRASEMVAMRAAGLSALRFLIAPSLGALLIGMVAVGVLNPLVTAMITTFAKEKGRPVASVLLYVENSGLWMRQGAQDGQVLINAGAADQGNLALQTVSFIGFGADGQPLWRIEADRAVLVPGAWQLSGGFEWALTDKNPQQNRKSLPEGALLPSDLTPDDLNSGFGNPTNVPFWSLADQIQTLERAGFSARDFRVWLQSEMAKPLFLVVMVLVAAGFTMRHVRAGNRAQMVLFAVLIGFGIFFLRSIAQVFGQNGHIPILLAAWGPTLAVSLLAISLLLHLEE